MNWLEVLDVIWQWISRSFHFVFPRMLNINRHINIFMYKWYRTWQNWNIYVTRYQISNVLKILYHNTQASLMYIIFIIGWSSNEVFEYIFSAFNKWRNIVKCTLKSDMFLSCIQKWFGNFIFKRYEKITSRYIPINEFLCFIQLTVVFVLFNLIIIFHFVQIWHHKTNIIAAPLKIAFYMGHIFNGWAKFILNSLYFYGLI